MRIALLVGEFPRAHQPFIYNQIVGLVNRRVDIDIYSTGRPESDDIADVSEKVYKQVTYTPIPESKPVRLLRSAPHFVRIVTKEPLALSKVANPLRFGKDAMALKPVYRLSPMLEESYDILHAHFGPTARIGAILKSTGVCSKLVATFHGVGVRQAKKNPDRYQHLFNVADRILTVSQHNHDELSRLGVEDYKLQVHHNGFQTDRFQFRWNDSIFPTPQDPIKILTVARLEKNQGNRICFGCFFQSC